MSQKTSKIQRTEYKGYIITFDSETLLLELFDRSGKHLFKSFTSLSKWRDHQKQEMETLISDYKRWSRKQKNNEFLDFSQASAVAIDWKEARIIDRRNRMKSMQNGRLLEVYDQSSFEQRKIILHILDNNKITIEDACSLVDLDNTETYHILTKMIEEHIIVKKASDSSTYYVLKDK